MAKKKDLFDDLDDINLDDFDMGNDFGMDDISFGSSGRTPVQKLKYSFKNAAKEKAGSLDFHLKTLKRILPKEYAGSLEAIGKGKSNLDTLYGKTLDKLRPMSNDLKEFARGISPAANKILPRGMREKLNAWANASDSSGSDYEDVAGARESIIGQNLQEIFATNLRETTINAAHQRKYQGFKDKVNYLRHAENRDIFRGIFKGISRIAGYNDNITFKWQRKTLELQYRTFYQNEDLLQRVSKGNELIVKALSAITRNTSLPDALKIEMKEMLGYETKAAIVRKLQTRTFGSVNAMVDRITTNLGRKIDDMLDTAGMITGGLGSAGSMAGSGMLSGHDMAASSILDQLAALGGDRLNGVIGRNSRLRGFGARLNANMQAGKAYAQHKAQTSSMWRFINDLMGDHDDLRIKNSGSGLKSAATIDNQVKKTWITVIPGLLARILREVTIFRTGDPSVGLTKYNFDKDRFMDAIRGKKHITSSLMSKGGGTYTRDSIKRVLEHIDPENKLSNKQKSILQRRIMDDTMEGKPFYANNYLDSSKYGAGDDRGDIASIIRFMRNEYKAGKKIRIGENYEIDTKRARAAELTKDLGLYVNDLILELDRQAMMGYEEELEEMGFIKQGTYGTEWDKARIRQFLLEEIGDDVVITPNESRDRRERLEANANRIRGQARRALDRLVRRSRVSLNRAGRRFRRLRGQQVLRRGSRAAPVPGLGGSASAQSETPQSRARRIRSRGNLGGNQPDISLGSDTTSDDPTIIPPRPESRRRASEAEITTAAQRNGRRRYLGGGDTSSSHEFHDTQLKMLEIQTKILEANIVQTRLLEGGLNVNGVVIQRGGLYHGLRAGTGKLLSGIGGILGGTFKLYGNMIGGVAGMVKGGFGLLGSIGGRMFQGIRYSDIYVRGNPRHPVLLARDLRAGLYRDKVSGKVIRRIRDIVGPVVDSDGNEVLTVEDINKGLYDIQGKPLLKGLANKVIGFYGAMLSPFVTVAKIANWTIKKSFGLLTRDKDVYVLGETSPRLLSRVLQAGGYRSAVTGKPIYSVRDIDGDVMDTTGEHVILSVSEMTKLVDRRGNPYRTAGEKFRDLVRGTFKYTVGLPFTMAWKLTKGVYKAGASIIKGGARLLGKIFRGFGLGSIRSLATSAAYGDLVTRNPELLINVHQNEILLSMLELLNARLPSSRPKRGDSDGDGYRDGSWQERIQSLRDTHTGVRDRANKKREERAPKNREDSNGGLLSGLLGGLGAKALKFIPKKLGFLAKALGAIGLGGFLGNEANAEDGSGEGGSMLNAGTVAGAAAGAGLMFPGKMLGLARGAGRLAFSGGGLLARGAMMLAPILASAATGIVGAISAPVVLTALGIGALGTGAYYLYKKYKGDQSSFMTLRMAQYGVLPDETDRIEKILELEKELENSVRINGDEVGITLTQKKLATIAGIFGITQANKEALNNWAIWIQNRFKPVFMKHSVMAFKYFGKTELSLLDEKLEPSQKLDVIKALAIPDNGTNYLKQYSPFGGELKTDYELTDMILNQSVVKIRENQGGNFIGRWWRDTFGTASPEAPKKTTDTFNIPSTIKDPNYKPTDPKTAYSQLQREAKGVGEASARGYRKLGEQTNNAIRRPFNDPVVTPTPATSANVSNTFSRRPALVSDIPATNGKYYLPVRGSVTSPFGQRNAPRAGASTNHKGIDLKAATGTPVVAMANGVIIKREVQRGYGNIVYLQHAGGIVSKYAHLSRFQEDQSVGMRVGGGQVIGYAGSTGRVTGPHLHFEIVDASGRQIDPEQFLKGSNSGSGAVSVNQAMIDSQARRFANDDIDVDDGPDNGNTPSVPNTATKPSGANKPQAYSGGKVFNPNVSKPTAKPKEAPKTAMAPPAPSEPIARDRVTRRQVQERANREQERTTATVESSRILSDILEVNKSMLIHLASIDRKTGGGVAPPRTAPDVQNPVSLKSNREIGS